MAAVLARYNRLFASDGRCLEVAVDHGLSGQAPAAGNMRRVIGTLVDAGPDAVQLSPGEAPLLQLFPGPDKPALVMRTDVTTAHYSQLVEDAVGRAVRLDAACVVASLLAAPDEPELERACLRNVARLKADCEPAGMPLLLAVASGDRALESTLPLVRQAVEIGADIVAVTAPGEVADYHRVIEMAGDRPVLAREEGRPAEPELLRRAEELIRQGAAGLVYAASVTGHQSPVTMTQALMAVVHGAMSADEALLALGD